MVLSSTLTHTFEFPFEVVFYAVLKYSTIKSKNLVKVVEETCNKDGDTEVTTQKIYIMPHLRGIFRWIFGINTFTRKKSLNRQERLFKVQIKYNRGLFDSKKNYIMDVSVKLYY